MKKSIERKIAFNANKSIEELKEETLKCFQLQGFKLSNSGTKFLEFERGSSLKNMVTRDPLKWNSKTKISFEDNQVFAKFNINTIHQAVMAKEEKLWDIFISNYQKTIETGESFITENELALKEAKKSQWKFIGYAIIGAILFGIPSGIIAYLTGIESILRVGTIAGSIGFMMYKINEEKESD